MTEIFVFGSNLSGRHGKGAALAALRRHGAISGQGVGLQGRSYAIPTKDKNLKTLAIPRIETYVRQFLAFARERPDLTFRLTPIGCGLAGYSTHEIAPLFVGAPLNAITPEAFEPWLSHSRR